MATVISTIISNIKGQDPFFGTLCLLDCIPISCLLARLTCLQQISAHKLTDTMVDKTPKISCDKITIEKTAHSIQCQVKVTTASGVSERTMQRSTVSAVQQRPLMLRWVL